MRTIRIMHGIEMLKSKNHIQCIELFLPLSMSIDFTSYGLFVSTIIYESRKITASESVDNALILIFTKKHTFHILEPHKNCGFEIHIHIISSLFIFSTQKLVNKAVSMVFWCDESNNTNDKHISLCGYICIELVSYACILHSRC